MFDRRMQDLEKSIFSRIYLFANGGTIASTNGWTGTGNSATKSVTFVKCWETQLATYFYI